MWIRIQECFEIIRCMFGVQLVAVIVSGPYFIVKVTTTEIIRQI